MKKAIYPVLAAILLLSLCACGHQQDDSSQVSPAISRPAVEHAPDYTTEEHDADGKLIRRNHHSGWNDTISSYYIFEYDGDRLIRETQYSSGGSVSDYTEYEYDAEGRLLRSSHYDTWFGTSFTIEYDRSGNHTHVTYYKKDGSIRYSSAYEYDSRGNMTRETHYHADGSLMDYNTREYNDAGQCVRHTDYNSDGSMFAYTIHEYDGDKRIRSIRYWPDGTKVPVAEYADPTV